MNTKNTVCGIEWRSRSDFTNRVAIVGSPSGIEAIISFPDGVILCDWCGREITTNPVAVIGGDAVCEKCLQEYGYAGSPGQS